MRLNNNNTRQKLVEAMKSMTKAASSIKELDEDIDTAVSDIESDFMKGRHQDEDDVLDAITEHVDTILTRLGHRDYLNLALDSMDLVQDKPEVGPLISDDNAMGYLMGTVADYIDQRLHEKVMENLEDWKEERGDDASAGKRRKARTKNGRTRAKDEEPKEGSYYKLANGAIVKVTRVFDSFLVIRAVGPGGDLQDSEKIEREEWEAMGPPDEVDEPGASGSQHAEYTGKVTLYYESKNAPWDDPLTKKPMNVQLEVRIDMGRDKVIDVKVPSSGRADHRFEDYIPRGRGSSHSGMVKAIEREIPRYDYPDELGKKVLNIINETTGYKWRFLGPE